MHSVNHVVQASSIQRETNKKSEVFIAYRCGISDDVGVPDHLLLPSIYAARNTEIILNLVFLLSLYKISDVVSIYRLRILRFGIPEYLL